MRVILYIKDVGGHAPICTVNGINGRDYHFMWDNVRAAHTRTYDLSAPGEEERFHFEQAEMLTHRNCWPIFVAVDASGEPTAAAPATVIPNAPSEELSFLEGKAFRLIKNKTSQEPQTLGFGVAFVHEGRLARIAVVMPRNPSEADLDEAFTLLTEALKTPETTCIFGLEALVGKELRVSSLAATTAEPPVVESPAHVPTPEPSPSDDAQESIPTSTEPDAQAEPPVEPAAPAPEESDPLPATPPPLESLSDDELRAIARENGIRGYAQAKRETLLAKLSPAPDAE